MSRKTLLCCVKGHSLLFRQVDHQPLVAVSDVEVLARLPLYLADPDRLGAERLRDLRLRPAEPLRRHSLPYA